MRQISSGPRGMGGSPLQFQEEHGFIPHASCPAHHGFDSRVDGFDDAEAHWLVAVGGDALDVLQHEVAEQLHLGTALRAERLEPSDHKIEDARPGFVAYRYRMAAELTASNRKCLQHLCTIR